MQCLYLDENVMLWPHKNGPFNVNGVLTFDDSVFKEIGCLLPVYLINSRNKIADVAFVNYAQMLQN